MAWRQARGAWRHFAVLFACVVLGVAALVAVGSLAAGVERTLGREAKALAGGDVEVRSARPLPPAAGEILDGLRREGAAVAAVRETVGMARVPATGATSLVEVKAVDAGYPLYGRLEIVPAAPPASLLDGGGAIVHRELLERLGLALGDTLSLGAATVVVRGVLEREPDRPATLFSLGPRVLVAAETLDRAALVRAGSRVRHRALVRLPEGVPPARALGALERVLEDPSIRLASFDEAQPGLRRFFAQMTTYLGLVGLASLLVGGIGVGSSVATFLRRQRETIAILKAVGAASRDLLGTYLLQTLVVGVLGSVAGAALGLALQPAVTAVLRNLLPFTLEPVRDPGTLARGVAMGVLATLLCALWPLLEVRAVRPALLLRRAVETGAAPPRPWAAALPVVAGLAALALWQAGSLKVGAIFLGASAVALLALAVLARVVVAAARRAPPLPWPAWRRGVASLRRPGGEPARVVVALGAGVMLLVAVALLQASLGRHLDHERRREAPSFFFVDVQPDQREAFVRVVAEAGGAVPALTPVVRARLAALDGVPITREAVEARRARGEERTWLFTREYALTWAGAAPPDTELTRGRWWSAAEGEARALVSVEEDAARHLGLDVGSRLTVEVQGVPVEAEVLSLRKVDWQAISTNFFMIFSPAALADAPASWVAAARVPRPVEAGVQRAVASTFPNVTAVPVRDVLQRATDLLGELATAVRLIAVFTVATGLVVMAGALTATRYQRLYESVVLRTLGATRGAVARAFAVEYACLGATAGLGGTGLAAVLAWVVLRFLLHAPWTFEPRAMLAGVATSVVLAVGVGFLATFRLLGQKPLPVLRRE
jgi:putative ABC transport system permease protein